MSGGRGLHIKLVNREIFAEDLLAGICVAHGCHPNIARKVANAVATAGEHKTTITQGVNMSQLRGGCGMIGVIVVEIPPRRV